MAAKIIFANALRGLAALSVVIAHYVITFWTPGPVIGQIANVPALPDGLIPKATRWIFDIPVTFSLAAFGVGLFFLISGLVIPLSLDRMTVTVFLRARAWRIIPTYVCGFLFTVAALGVASAVYSRPFPYTAREVAIHLVPGMRLLTGSKFIDYVVWTLEIEICFYLLCAAMAHWLRRGSLLVLIVPSAFLILATHYPWPLSVLPSYLQALDFMFIGVIFSYHHDGKLETFTTVIAGLFVTTTSVASIFSTQGLNAAGGYALAGGLFAACYLRRSVFPDLAPLRWLAAISYPLYVVHGIMGYVTIRIMIDYGFQPSISMLVAFVSAILISTALHFVIEVPTQHTTKQTLA
jgi:peptidoglycan/LPS O-acetylase OafA/YrhL